ncbi:MAG: HlyC/CorC family transporter [Acidobacteria bacterium]|nr:HlyC/CorC family transporter [Acidobacteriota bacterium]
MTAVIGISFVLVVLNAVFVAAEFALIAAPKPALEQRASKGDRFAERILGTRESPKRQDEYVATSQIGITLASLGLGMYGEHALAGLLEARMPAVPHVLAAPAVASLLALALLTIVHIVVGEMVPKAVALQHPVPVSRFTHWPMRVTWLICYPLVRLSNGLALLVLRLVGLRRQQAAEQVYTPEELQLIVEESERGGAIRAESSRILQELFEFGDLTAAEIMVPRVRAVGIPLGAGPDELRQIITKQRHTRYPVYDGDLDHIVGMLHVKDLLRSLAANERLGPSDVRRLPVVPETASLDDVLATMQRAHAHLAVVIDEHGGTAGIVALEDLFEEVVGEIDEGAPALAPIAPLPDGSARVAGTVRLDELGQYFEIDLQHEDVDSVSGLVLERLGRLPAVGDVVEYGPLRLEVLSTAGRGVREVRVTRAADAASRDDA